MAGETVSIDPRPGGRFLMRMPNGATARGEFVEMVPARRVVFTWGWVDHPGVPPGSSTVEIDIVSDDGGSLLTLTHSGLPDEVIEIHVVGWEHYLARLSLSQGRRAWLLIPARGADRARHPSRGWQAGHQ